MPLLDAAGYSAVVLVHLSRPTLMRLQLSQQSVAHTVEGGCSPCEMQNAKSDREEVSMKGLP